MLKDRRVIFRADEQYFMNFKNKKLYGIDIRIPENAEKYLEFKYGKNWEKPVKEWIWWRDDGAMYKKDLFKVSYFRFKKRLDI